MLDIVGDKSSLLLCILFVVHNVFVGNKVDVGLLFENVVLACRKWFVEVSLIDLNVVISMPESVDICPEKSSVFLLDSVSWFEVSVFPRSWFIGPVETWVEFTCRK